MKGSPVGIVVDRVLEVTQIEKDFISAPRSLKMRKRTSLFQVLQNMLKNR